MCHLKNSVVTAKLYSTCNLSPPSLSSNVLVWFGLVWFGLVWFGLVWFGLVWFGSSRFQVLASMKKRKAQDLSNAEREQIAQEFMFKINQAAEDDEEAVKEGRPALSKLKMLKVCHGRGGGDVTCRISIFPPTW